MVPHVKNRYQCEISYVNIVTARKVVFISGNRATRGGLFLLTPQTVRSGSLVRKQLQLRHWTPATDHRYLICRTLSQTAALHLTHKLSFPTDANLGRSALPPVRRWSPFPTAEDCSELLLR